MITTLEIDGRAIPTLSILEFDQGYDDLLPSEFRRTANNTGILRSAGTKKLRTVINGKGWAPPALAGLDRGSTHTLRCAMPNSVESATTSVTLPAARRSDAGHTPIGFAVVGDELVETTISSIVANVATLVSVAGASGYVVHYWPEITAVILANTTKGVSSANFEWTIEAEEV